MTEKQILIELLSGKSLDTSEDVEHVAEYLLRSGVRVPPVVVGATVYEFRHKAIYNGRRTDSSISTQRLLKMAVSRGDDIYISGKPYTKSDYIRLGSTVFLTVEEAAEELQLFGVENAVKFI